MQRPLASALVFLVAAAAAAAEPLRFGAYHTRLENGADWESRCRSGPHADVVVRVAEAGGDLVFWRGTGYLPEWRTPRGTWRLAEIVPRRGDGPPERPDRANVYSNVAIVASTPDEVTVRWRYLARFAPGNPHGDVRPDNVVEETFVISRAGTVERTVRRGTPRIDAWDDPAGWDVQRVRLRPDGIEEKAVPPPLVRPQPTRVGGNPRLDLGVAAPAVWFRCDEGEGDTTREERSGDAFEVRGHKSLWTPGVSGASLAFDGYHSAIVIPADKVPKLTGSITVEGWVALGAYPWNWAPLVQQGDESGFFLGIDGHGYPGFGIRAGDRWELLAVPGKPPYKDRLALRRWYHLAGTYDAATGVMRLYVDGRELARGSAPAGGVAQPAAELRIGKAGIPRVPTEGTHDNLASDFGLDALIDEVRLHAAALDGDAIARAAAVAGKTPPAVAAESMPPRALPRLDTGGRFGAVATRLRYHPTWDNLWRVGPQADVVVGFDRLPTKLVFWRGVSYIPMLVNDSGQWFTQEFNETGFTPTAPGDCEPMSDKGCRDSHVRIIEPDGPRAVVHWRYRLINSEYHWANLDEHGWGDIADWQYHVYPDGVAVKIMRCYSSKPETWHEWNEQIAILGEGQHPEQVLGRTPVMTLVDGEGRATTYDWNPDPPRPDFRDKTIQLVHLTGRHKPFAIQRFDGGGMYLGERTWYSVFPTWNHWPTAQINSSGRNASFPDRAAHASISQLEWPVSRQQRGAVPFEEKILMEGLTDRPAAELLPLARSWLDPPPAVDVTGGTGGDYAAGRRTYVFDWRGEPLAFALDASARRPVRNLCFEVRNWPGPATAATLIVDGSDRAPGPAFRQAVRIAPDASWTLVVWLELSADEPCRFQISARDAATADRRP